jgi:hypothetical protein
MDEIAFPEEASIDGVRQLSGTLLHESGSRMWCHACNVDLPGGQFHDNQHVVRQEAVPGGDFDREEGRRGENLPVKRQELCPTVRLPNAG